MRYNLGINGNSLLKVDGLHKNCAQQFRHYFHNHSKFWGLNFYNSTVNTDTFPVWLSFMNLYFADFACDFTVRGENFVSKILAQRHRQKAARKMTSNLTTIWMLNYDYWITEVVGVEGLWRRRNTQKTQKFWNDLLQKLVARAVQNFYSYLQACVDNVGEHYEHIIMTDIRHSISIQPADNLVITTTKGIRKAPACLLTLLYVYGKPRLCINVHHYAPPIGSTTQRAATSMARLCGINEGSMSSFKSITWNELC